MTVTREARPLAGGERGQILILTALSLSVLLGIAALSIDSSFMFDKRNRLSAAADAAAKSAAMEYRLNPAITATALRNFANQQVALHGFTPTTSGGTTSVVVNHPPSASSAFSGNASYVEVVVSEPTSTFFGKVLGWASLTPGARAVAGVGAPQNCLIAKNDLTIGNTTLAFSGCGVAVAGNLSGSNPNAAITPSPGTPVAVTGACSGTCSSMGTLATGSASPIDPLAGLTQPPNPGGCIAGTAASLPAGCYTSIASTVTSLSTQNGVYYVTGPVTVGNLSGTNVMLYLTGGGQITSGNNKSLTVTAPTSGPYAGIAIFQDPADTNSWSTGNNFSLSVSGAIYMPGVDVNIANHVDFASTGCSLFLARSITIANGSGAMSSTGCASAYASAKFLSMAMAE